MKRPFVSLFIFILIGILCAHYFQYDISIIYLVLATAISLIVFMLWERGSIFFILLTASILGAYLYGQSIIGDTILKSAPENKTVIARILKEGSFNRGFTEYEIDVLSFVDKETRKTITINKKAQLRVYESVSDQSIFMVDDILKIKNIRVRKLLDHKDDIKPNSYELYLKTKGIEYILEANSANVKIDPAPQNKLIGIRRISYKIKIYIEDYLDSTLDFENSDILKSIILGNQGYLSKERLNIFSKTGTAHIMAVSGLHVGLIVLIIDKFLKIIKIGRNNRLHLTVLILIFYGFMVYFPVSIIRAGFMYILYVGAYFLERRYDSINALFFIAFVLLIYRPMTVFSISFQLSFTATLSILLLGPILNKALKERLGFLASLLSVTLAAQIGTLPIMAYHFKQISVISLGTNLLIIPLLAPIISIAFLSILIGSLSFRAGFIVNQINNQLLNYVHWISAKCAIIPYGSFEIKEVKIIYILGYYITIAIIYFIYRQTSNKESNFQKKGLVNLNEL